MSITFKSDSNVEDNEFYFNLFQEIALLVYSLNFEAFKHKSFTTAETFSTSNTSSKFIKTI